MPVCVNFYHPNIIKKIKKGYKKKCLWRYQNLLKEEKKKKWQYGCECYKNFSKDEWFSTEKILRNEKKHLIIKSNTHNVLLKVYTEWDKSWF